MSPPRKGDKWLMQAAREAGVTDPGELVMLNRFRCHQQVLFLLDVLDAGGWRLNKKYLNHRQDHEVWSTLIFPLEKLPRQYISLWQEVLSLLVPRGRVHIGVG